MARTRAFYATRAAAVAVLGGGAATGFASRIARRTAFAEAPSKDDVSVPTSLLLTLFPNPLDQALPTQFQAKIRPTQLTPTQLQIPEKKPIYADHAVSIKEPTLPDSKQSIVDKAKSSKSSTSKDSSSLTTSPTPTDRLTTQVKKARLALHSLSQSTENTVNDVFTWAFRTETNIANTIASLAPKPETGEQILPGAIYVLVATMAGSIISRNRGILLRAITPLGFGLVAGWSLIPVTMQNTADLLWVYEKKVPVVSETHAFIGGFAREAWLQIKDRSQGVTEWADQTAGQGRRRVEGWVEKGR